MSKVIRIEGLTFNKIQYPDIDIEASKTTIITGDSGCGKSSLLKMFNATLNPSSGNVYYEGVNINDVDTIKLRREILLIGQSVYLFDKSIKENFAEFYHYRDEACPDDDTIKYYLQLAFANFPLDTMCQTLSGGERQRVFIAINLSFKPKVIMLDEPTSALDNKTAINVIKNLKMHSDENNITLIIVSHDKQLIDSLGDRVISLGGEGVCQA